VAQFSDLSCCHVRRQGFEKRQPASRLVALESRHDAARLRKVWCVQHNTVDLHGAGRAGIKCRDDALGPEVFGISWCEASVYDFDLRWVNRGFRRKPIATSGVGFTARLAY
jgi:hypothetical protein